MSRGTRVLDDAYIFEGKHYLPGPGGFGVVDLNGQEVDLPDNFPEEKLAVAKDRIKAMEAEAFRGFNRVPTADSRRADGHAGVQPQDIPSRHMSDEDEDEAEGAEDGEDYESMTVDELAAACDERGCEVKGSGSGGKVLKKDYIKALKKADKAEGE